MALRERNPEIKDILDVEGMTVVKANTKIESATMSIFGKIMGAIFGTHAEAATPASAPEAGGGHANSTSKAAAAGSNVDVAAILDKAVA